MAQGGQGPGQGQGQGQQNQLQAMARNLKVGYDSQILMGWPVLLRVGCGNLSCWQTDTNGNLMIGVFISASI